VQLGDDRVQEIARMLGDAGDRVVVQHAQELLRKTRVAAAR
jgi:DNA repair ATPase RecN